MKQIFLPLMMILLLLVTACQPTPSGQVVLNDPVKIGSIISLTGWGSYWGKGAVRGIALAEQDINTKEQQKVDVIVEDSRTTNNGAVAAVNKLLDVDGVDAIYVEFTGPSTSIAPIVENHDEVMLYNAFPSSLIDEQRNVLKTYFTDYDGCARLAGHALSQGYKRIGFLSLNLAFAGPCRQAIYDTIKGTSSRVVFDQVVDLEETDFRTDLLKMRQAKPDVIIAILYEDHAINFLEQEAELDMHIPLYCGGKNDCFTDKVLQTVPSEQLVGAVTFDLSIDEGFVLRYKQLYPGAEEVEVQAAALSYDSIRILYELEKSCTTSECALNLADHSSFPTVVDNDGFHNRVLALNTVIKEFNGKRFVKV